MKLVKSLWNVLLGLNMYAAFRENGFFRRAILMSFTKMKEIIEFIIKYLD